MRYRNFKIIAVFVLIVLLIIYLIIGFTCGFGFECASNKWIFMFIQYLLYIIKEKNLNIL